MADEGAYRSSGSRRTSAIVVAAVAIALGVVAGPGHAVAYHEDLSRDDVRQLDRFLDDHPWVARDLRRDPSLATNRRYLDDHRSLREFLADHPTIRRALRDDPWAVLRREHRYDREERRYREITPDDLRRFARFLRDHPAVAHDLRSDPSLVVSRSYLASRPSFRDFLEDNPEIREELQDNPYAFLRRFERYQREAAKASKAPRKKR